MPCPVCDATWRKRVLTKGRKEIREKSVKFLRDHAGEKIHVGGMWTGDFVGVCTEIGLTGAEFKLPDGTKQWFPYCTALALTVAE